jgi:hypothetical protein
VVVRARTSLGRRRLTGSRAHWDRERRPHSSGKLRFPNPSEYATAKPRDKRTMPTALAMPNSATTYCRGNSASGGFCFIRLYHGEAAESD